MSRDSCSICNCSGSLVQLNAGGTTRCKDCHNLKARIQTAISHNEELVPFTKLSIEKRNQFLGENKGLFGKSLVQAMTATISRQQTTLSKENFRESGTFLTEKEVREKYNEQTAEAILRNARKMQDPVKEIMLYEDTTYTRVFDKNVSIQESTSHRLDLENTPASIEAAVLSAAASSLGVAAAPEPQAEETKDTKKRPAAKRAAKEKEPKKPRRTSDRVAARKVLALLEPLQSIMTAMWAEAQEERLKHLVLSYSVSNTQAMLDSISSVLVFVFSDFHQKNSHA